MSEPPSWQEIAEHLAAENARLRQQLTEATDTLTELAPASLGAQLADARMWARHGYEIGQRSCTWSDHGVAPRWLTEGHDPAALVGPDPHAGCEATIVDLRQQADDWARAHRWYELKAELEAVTKERNEVRRAALLEAADELISWGSVAAAWLRERAERETTP